MKYLMFTCYVLSFQLIARRWHICVSMYENVNDDDDDQDENEDENVADDDVEHDNVAEDVAEGDDVARG